MWDGAERRSDNWSSAELVPLSLAHGSQSSSCFSPHHLVLGCCCKQVPAVCIAQVDIQVLNRGAVTLLQGSDEVELLTAGVLQMKQRRRSTHLDHCL